MHLLSDLPSGVHVSVSPSTQHDPSPDELPPAAALPPESFPAVADPPAESFPAVATLPAESPPPPVAPPPPAEEPPVDDPLVASTPAAPATGSGDESVWPQAAPPIATGTSAATANPSNRRCQAPSTMRFILRP
jgi:hypothetical protein